ncbi:MAG TPA: helix-turn-helix domain-containing protein [Roseiarcus sp.]|jgi:excisionase family DNA binding protein
MEFNHNHHHAAASTAQFYTRLEVIARTRLSRATIDRYIADGRLRVVRFGRSVRISESALAEFIAEASK